MNRPNSVKIGALTYTVKEDLLTREAGCWGQCSSALLEIRLEPDMAPAAKDTIFIHECVEAMNWVYDIGLKHHQIELLESAFFQFIVDNPAIFRDGASE